MACHFPLSLTLFERGDRKATRGFCPARSRTLVAGAAGWGEDGRGARCSCVYSSFSLVVSSGEFGEMPVTGVMPMGRVLLAFAGSAWWPAVVVLLVMLVRFQWSLEDLSRLHPRISSSLAWAPDLAGASSSFPLCHRGGDRRDWIKMSSVFADLEFHWEWKLAMVILVLSDAQRRPLLLPGLWFFRPFWSFICLRFASMRDRVERRLRPGFDPLFSPFQPPCWEALFSLPRNGEVLVGDGGSSFSDEVGFSSRTRLHSEYMFGGPVWKKEGRVCNFLFRSGPSVSCQILFL